MEIYVQFQGTKPYKPVDRICNWYFLTLWKILLICKTIRTIIKSYFTFRNKKQRLLPSNMYFLPVDFPLYPFRTFYILHTQILFPDIKAQSCIY